MKTIFTILVILWSATVFASDTIILNKCNNQWTMNVISNAKIVHSCSGSMLDDKILHNIKNKTKVAIYGDNGTPLIFEKNNGLWIARTKNRFIGHGQVLDNNILRYHKTMKKVVIYTN